MNDLCFDPRSVADRIARAARIADRSAVADIESHGVQERINDERWYDVRLMLDEREGGPEWVEMSREVIDYALERGLVKRHPVHAHLLKVIRQP